MLHLSDELIQAERRAELRRQADRHRLIRSLSPGEPRPPRRLDEALNALGGVLIAWGCRLQARYERILQVSAQPADALPLPPGRLAAGGSGNSSCAC